MSPRGSLQEDRRLRAGRHGGLIARVHCWVDMGGVSRITRRLP